MSAQEVLTAFRHDAPYLFLGAAFAAVGLMSAAFAVLRRRRDSLLICFALFAAVYGIRLWISSPMLAMMAQGATFYTRLRGAVTLGLPTAFSPNRKSFSWATGSSTLPTPSGLPCLAKAK